MKVSNGTLTVDLRPSTIRDGWLRTAIFDILQKAGGRTDRDTEYHVFARVCSQGTIEGLPFPLPTSADDDAAVVASFHQWVSCIDEAFHDRLVIAIGKLLRSADEALGPVPLLEDAPKN